jgi:hypothetical protein
VAGLRSAATVAGSDVAGPAGDRSHLVILISTSTCTGGSALLEPSTTTAVHGVLDLSTTSSSSSSSSTWYLSTTSSTSLGRWY